ncbi:hypothetical protein PhCBS80983_g06442 [Powellomyces hirtus]|uniref:Integrase catalytic domain-containing protein n=1 Tax=Powellomyces hirtus TaxID=109895 RepID=A0A507DNM1_9FUNG|nr:hypothetical protein PhCBS80983_g06442 [Powellomyces hirtus]
MDELRKLFYTPGAPTGATSLPKLLKKEGVDLSMKTVKDFLTSESSHQIHRKKKRLNLNVAITQAPFDVWESDWLSLGHDVHLKSNKGCAHILICVDKFSKMVWAVPVKTVDETSITLAMREIIHDNLSRYGMRPNKLLTDAGGAYKSAKWKKLMDEYNISHSIVYMAYEAERSVKTVKSAIGHVLTQRGDKKWIDVLDDLVKMINKREHRGLQMSPNEAIQHPLAALKNLEQYWSKIKQPEPTVYKVGTHVRTRVDKATFTKGHWGTFSNEVYKITHVFPPADDYHSHRYALEGIRSRVFTYNDIMETKDPVTIVQKKKKPLDRLQKQARKELREMEVTAPLPTRLRSEKTRPNVKGIRPKES